MANKSKNLTEAKKNKNDEFYTQLTDIEKEIKHYREHFKGKTVFCNCDDPEWSNFWKFFHMQFQFLGLKKLISTHYVPSVATNDKAYKLECVSITEIDGKLETSKAFLQGDGDFRSPECVELLKQSDIVVTNPPFSLFREYVAQLIEYDKKFLIIGNMNAITCKEVFKLIKDNKLWLGISPRSMNFELPNGEMKSVNSVWFTNLEHKKRNEKLILFREYVSESYPKYDNYDAIEVGKVAEIPVDYDGAMGVPITFLDKFNPEQFEIVGMDVELNNKKRFSIDGKTLYARIIIKRKENHENGAS